MKEVIFSICLILFALPTWAQDLHKTINKFFPKQIEVYGVKIIGTENTPFNNIKKAANIFNQWLQRFESKYQRDPNFMIKSDL